MATAFSMAKKIRDLGRAALARSEKEALLDHFDLETTEHSMALLEMLLAACRQDTETASRRPAWLDALDDDQLPIAAKVEALSGLKEMFLRMLRVAHDPVLGNKMLALATTGLRASNHSEDLKARVLVIASQLVPPDVDLLYRYHTEGCLRIEIAPDGRPVLFPRKLVQESFRLRFVMDDNELSSPLDTYAYNSLKRHNLVQDLPWFNDPDLPRGKPPVLDLGFKETHKPFKLEWRPTLLGQVVLEAFTGRPLTSFAVACQIR